MGVSAAVRLREYAEVPVAMAAVRKSADVRGSWEADLSIGSRFAAELTLWQFAVFSAATPASTAAFDTALATSAATRLSNTLGMM